MSFKFTPKPGEVEHKNFGFEIKKMDDATGMIEGYASTFGNVDLGFDIVDKGAFTKTLVENVKIPILKDHNMCTQVGWNHEAKEDDVGLLVMGKYNMEDPLARGAYALAKQGLEIGAKVGLSIGYITIKAEPDRDNPMIRRLKELKLLEYSQVTFPMNTAAMMTAAKSFAQCMDMKSAVEAFMDEMGRRGYTVEEVIKQLQGKSEPPDTHSKEILETLAKINKSFLRS